MIIVRRRTLLAGLASAVVALSVPFNSTIDISEIDMEEAIQIALEALIKPFEGFGKRIAGDKCCAYPDPATGGAPWTIGWGSTGSDINKDTVWSIEQARERLYADVLHFAVGVARLCPTVVVHPRRYAALISFAYNCGLGSLRISTLRRRVLEEDWEAAATQIQKWNKANGKVLRGLTIRRQAEAKLLA